MRTTLFGWCRIPLIAAQDHQPCPGQLGMDAGIWTCSCSCHNPEGGI